MVLKHDTNDLLIQKICLTCITYCLTSVFFQNVSFKILVHFSSISTGQCCFFLLHGIAFVFILLKLLDYLFTQTKIIQDFCKIVSIINTAPNMPLPTLPSPNYKSNVHIPKYKKKTCNHFFSSVKVKKFSLKKIDQGSSPRDFFILS